MMFGKLKYLFLYLYEASERMEEKSKEFAVAREKRMEKFREEQAAARERMQAMYVERKEEAKKVVQDMVAEAGIATKSEMNELKKSVADLSTKLDRLAKKETD